MKFSIVIPVKNEAAVIDKLIHHIKSTAYNSDFGEVIIVDGGSTDETVSIAKATGATVVHSPKQGRAIQMNYGASQSQFPYLFFLHADTFPPLHWDLILKNALTHNKSYAGCFRLSFNSNHPLLKAYAWFTRFDWRFVRYGDQGLVVKKSLFNEIKGFIEELIVMEDNDIVYRLKEKTPFTIISKNVITSARKYEKNGIIRLQLIFGLIYYGYQFGLSQDVLIHIYRTLIKT